MTLSVILPRRGWELIKKSKNYAYLKPPSGVSPPFKINIAIPTQKEFIAIATRQYQIGLSWVGQLGEFPACYRHERNMDMVKFQRDRASGEMISQIIHEPAQSSLTIGEYGVWEAYATTEDGTFKTNSFNKSDDILSTLLNELDSPLVEGRTIETVITTYERNSKARKACIAHYGAVCQSCGFNYQEKYGLIGVGAIHVHHITPISLIKADYIIDPIRDLIPLCANCHQIAHRRNPPFSVDEIKNAIQSQFDKPIQAIPK